MAKRNLKTKFAHQLHFKVVRDDGKLLTIDPKTFQSEGDYWIARGYHAYFDLPVEKCQDLARKHTEKKLTEAIEKADSEKSALEAEENRNKSLEQQLKEQEAINKEQAKKLGKAEQNFETASKKADEAEKALDKAIKAVD